MQQEWEKQQQIIARVVNLQQKAKEYNLELLEDIKQRKKEEEKLKPRQPVYKTVKVRMPHCPICKMQLVGNNSISHPWVCDCGEWEWDGQTPTYYRIKIKHL